MATRAAQPEAELRRVAPRPLPLHLGTAMSIWSGALAALPWARNGLLPWSPELAGEAGDLAAALASADPTELAAAVAAEGAQRLEALLAGIDAYRRHPYRRKLADPPVIWREGGSRLLDYGGDAAAPAALFVPSLVNRAYVLDLSRRRSMLRHLAGQGIRPLLLDWGAPGEAERDFTLTDYIAGRLDRALDAAIAATGGPVGLVGYCMGGLLTLALAQARPQAIWGHALLAVPWDFHADGQAPLFAAAPAWLDPLLGAFGEMPVDVLQTFFAALDPNLAGNKFRAFAALDADGAAAKDFVALEDWVNDGVPLARHVARECLAGWYGDNTPGRGEWRVGGVAVRPQSVMTPSLVVIPRQDRIVPPASARALAAALPHADSLTPAMGHIGMVVGSGAARGLWGPLAKWLKATASR